MARLSTIFSEVAQKLIPVSEKYGNENEKSLPYSESVLSNTESRNNRDYRDRESSWDEAMESEIGRAHV